MYQLWVKFVKLLKLSKPSLENKVGSFQEYLLLSRACKDFDDLNHLSEVALEFVHSVFKSEIHWSFFFYYLFANRINNLYLNFLEILNHSRSYYDVLQLQDGFYGLYETWSLIVYF